MQQLSEQEIKRELKGLSGWSFDDDKIRKKYEFKNFKEALAFIVRVGFEAEGFGHHPNIFNIYNQVNIDLQTHDVGNKVTENDINLAKAIESVL
tara:strand:+ start:6178 stop:6459 length:282 start_codon:yes stop_codon:yes gene_type:complete